jgi:hypothetical protein
MTALVNGARGEQSLTIDGRAHTLCVTLGALAELETAFDAPNLTVLAERLATLSPSDLIVVLSALTKGGGAPLSPSEIAAARIDPGEAARAVAAAFRSGLDGA